MKPGPVSIYRYSIPFVRPVPVRRTKLVARDGLVLGLGTTDDEHTGFGEIAPLPGLHEETLDDALEQCRAAFRNCRISSGSLSLQNAGGGFPENLCPSVHCGIEMALLNLQAAACGEDPSFPGAPQAGKQLPLNALLFGDTRTILSMAEDYFRQGYRTFKLKVQAASPALAVEQTLALRRAFGGGISLRLDSNCSFGLDEACSLFGEIPGGDIEYVEEPLADPMLIPEFFRRTGIPSALDESLWMNPGIWDDIPPDCLGGLVLKPSMLGSFSTTLRLALEAKAEGIPAVISSAYESGIGLGFYARLASVLTADPPACGLDTFRQFSRDILSEPLHAEKGCIAVEEAYRNSLEPDLSRLELLEEWTL